MAQAAFEAAQAEDDSAVFSRDRADHLGVVVRASSGRVVPRDILLDEDTRVSRIELARCVGEAIGNARRDLDGRKPPGDANGADVGASDPATAADHGQQPARISALLRAPRNSKWNERPVSPRRGRRGPGIAAIGRG